MTNNPILDELHAARAKLLADAGGNLHKYLEGVRRREAASGRLLPQSEMRPADRVESPASAGSEKARPLAIS